MNRTYVKNILRDIKNTKGKVISIASMVGLAAAVVVGLSLSGTTMRNTLDNSLKTYGHPDLIIRSTYGLDYEDEIILSNDPDIKNITFVKTADVLDGETLIRVKSYNEDIPKAVVTKGRLPKAKNEITVDQILEDQYKIGDKISFSYVENARIDDEKLRNMNYEVVGFMKTSDYFMEDMREMSFTAKKELDGYGYILEENFDTDKYGEINISYKYTDAMDINSDSYRKFVRDKQEKIEDDIANRPEEVLRTIKKDANDELDEAEADIADAREEISDAEKQLKDARSELDQAYIDYDEGKNTLEEEISKGRDELEEARVKLVQGENELANGRAEYQRNLDNFNNQIANARNEISATEARLNDSQRELDAGRADIEEGQRQLENEFAGPRKELNDAKARLDSSKAELDRKSAEISQLENALANGMTIDPNVAIYNSTDSQDNPADIMPAVSAEEVATMRSELEAARSQYQAGLNQWQAQKNELDSRYNEEKSKLDSALAEINNNQQSLDRGWNELRAAKNELENRRQGGLAELNNAERQLTASQNEIASGWQEYNDGLARLEAEEADGREKLKESYQKLVDGEAEYQENLEKFEKEKADAMDEIAEGEDEIKEGRQALVKLVDPVYGVETIYDNEGIKTYSQNSYNMDELTKVFPTFFYLVAMLVTLTTMKRFIEEQRTINGTLKALGYSNADISKRFYLYGIIPTLIGSIIGALVGRYLISNVIINAYSSGFRNIGIDFGNTIPYILFSIILSVALIALTVYFSSKETVTQTPASLLREKAPNVGKRILLERIDPIWQRLSFMAKITSRNLFRYKARMFMTLFGVGGCTALTFFGFAMIDSIKETVSVEQNEISHYDVISIIDENATDQDLSDFENVAGNYNNLAIRFEEFTISFDDEKRNANIVIPSDASRLDDFVSLRTPKRETIVLDNEDAILTEKAADALGLSIGDSIKFDYEGNTYDLPISNIAENYTGNYIYISADSIERLINIRPKMNAYYLKGDADNVITDIEDQEAVIAIINASVIYASIDVLMANLNIVIGVITLISMMLALVVLYNLININVSERRKELATIKVLGFYPKEVTGYIFREIFILTLLGIIVGYGLGYAMFRYIIYVVAPEDIMLYYRVSARPFVMSGLITIAISLVLLMVVHRRLKNIDMAEAMSSGE